MQNQGQKVANPLKNNPQIHAGLVKMFGNEVADKLTTKDVYKYSGPCGAFKNNPPAYFETRTRNNDGTVTIKVIRDKRK